MAPEVSCLPKSIFEHEAGIQQCSHTVWMFSTWDGDTTGQLIERVFRGQLRQLVTEYWHWGFESSERLSSLTSLQGATDLTQHEWTQKVNVLCRDYKYCLAALARYVKDIKVPRCSVDRLSP